MKKSVYVEDREMMVWMPIIAVVDGIPQIGKYNERCGHLTEEEIQAFVDYCGSNNLNWCITERV